MNLFYVFLLAFPADSSALTCKPHGGRFTVSPRKRAAGTTNQRVETSGLCAFQLLPTSQSLRRPGYNLATCRF